MHSRGSGVEFDNDFCGILKVRKVGFYLIGKIPGRTQKESSNVQQYWCLGINAEDDRPHLDGKGGLLHSSER